MITAQARRQFTVASIIAGLVAGCVLVWHASQATFTGYTTNPGNSWQTATLQLSDDDSSNSAMFGLSGVQPGDSGQRCIVLTYNGTAPAPVRMYTKPASYTGTALGTYLTITVSEGPAGTYADTTCSNWSSGQALYTGLLSDFAASKTSYATGVANPNGAWTPYTTGITKVFKVAWSLSLSAPNSTQGGSVGIGFTWEAQNMALGSTNLALGKSATSSTPCSVNETAAKAVNGSVSGGTSDRFCSTSAPYYLQVDLGATASITSFTVRHSVAGGDTVARNTRDYDIDVSTNGSSWTNVVQARGANSAVTSHSVSTSGRYVKLSIVQGQQADNLGARIYEFEVYG